MAVTNSGPRVGFYDPTEETYLLEDQRVFELFRILNHLEQQIPGIGQREKDGLFSGVSQMGEHEVDTALTKLSPLIQTVKEQFQKYNLGIQRALSVKRPEEAYTEEVFLKSLYKLQEQLEDRKVEKLLDMLENLDLRISGIGQREKNGLFSGVSQMDKNAVDEALGKLSALIKEVQEQFQKYNPGIQRALGVTRPEKAYTAEDFLEPLYKLQEQIKARKSEFELDAFLDALLLRRK